jgi:hypothetical protein
MKGEHSYCYLRWSRLTSGQIEYAACFDAVWKTLERTVKTQRSIWPFERLISDGKEIVSQQKLAVQRGEIEFSGAYPPPASAVEAYVDAERWRKPTGRESVLHRIVRKAYQRRANDPDYKAELARQFREAINSMEITQKYAGCDPDGHYCYQRGEDSQQEKYVIERGWCPNPGIHRGNEAEIER